MIPADATLIERIALATAQAKWPALVRTCPEVGITYKRDTGRFAGYAMLPDCKVVVNRTLPPPLKCGVLVHEFGHLAGLGHAERGIMRPVFNRGAIPAGCRKLAQ